MHILFKYLKQYLPLIFLTLFLAAINQIFSLLDPYILRLAIEEFTGDIGKFTYEQYFWGIGFWIFLAWSSAMVSRIAKNFQDYYANVITQKIGAQIYQDGLKHSLKLPFGVFEDQRSGETLGVLQKVRIDIEKLINTFVNVLFTSVIGIIFVMVIALKVYWMIAPIFILTIPILGFLSSILSRKIKTVQSKIVGETTALAGATTESLRNIELIKSLGLENQEINRLNQNTEKILKLELKKVRILRSLGFIQGTTVNFLRNCLLFLLLCLIFEQKITVPQFYMFMIYSFFIFGPLQELGNIINVYREAQTSLNNLDKILKRPIEPRPENPEVLENVDRFEFKDVIFKHETATYNALDGISFDVDKGETIAFVGPSGAGKSTLVKLLVGLYSPLEGSILYNGVSSFKIDKEKFREKIGFVTQDTQLFAGSIRENLAFVNPNATESDMMEVLNKASCQNLLARASQGLDTMIGEGGVKLSGGEKQRLSIARALLRKPQLLVFDEATSALDSLTEEEISATIRELSQQKNQITILIAHRLSTIMHADKIFVLEKGKVVESGNHIDLLEQKGLYFAMWRQQIGERK